MLLGPGSFQPHGSFAISGHEPASLSYADLPYDLAPPALLFGPMGSERSATADLMRDAGLRLADVDRMDEAAARIERQVALGLVWVEAGGETIPDSLLAALASHAARGPGRVVVSASTAQIDRVVGALGEHEAQILVETSTIERGRPAMVGDVGRENAKRLRQISDEMGRFAATLARLSSD